MKKTLFFMLLLLLGVGMAVFNSCRKTESVRIDGKDDTLIPASDAEIEQRIRVFKQQCEFLARNPGIKNTSMMEYDEAFWLMEASLNYSYASPNASFKMSRVDSCFITIPKAGDDSVVFQNVAITYETLKDSLSKMFYETQWSDKQLLLADISLKDITDPNNYTLKMSVAIGKVTDEQIPFGNPYTPDDFWFYAGGLGHCGPLFPSGYGSDANIELCKYQDWFRPFIALMPGSHVYYTDIEDVHISPIDYPNPDDSTPNDNMYDYLIFINDPSLPNYHDCLSPQEMWFYLQGLYHIVTDPDKASSMTNPPFKDFMSLTLTSEIDVNFTISYHLCIKYGIRHMSMDPELPAALPVL